MDITLTLSADEEAALRDQISRSQDARLTVDTQAAALLHGALAPIVSAFLRAQSKDVVAILESVDPDTRQSLVATIKDAAPKPRLPLV